MAELERKLGQQALEIDLLNGCLQRIGRETTLTRLYHESDGRIRLQPANASMQPIIVDAEEVQIQGRVLAVLRKYR
jgi:SOS-response transcriptional repressor LexA